MSDVYELDLPTLCRSRGLSYNQGYRLLLLGRIDGERRAGRWFVSRTSLERLDQQLAESAKQQQSRPSPNDAR